MTAPEDEDRHGEGQHPDETDPQPGGAALRECRHEDAAEQRSLACGDGLEQVHGPDPEPIRELHDGGAEERERHAPQRVVEPQQREIR